ncbi:cytochrome oxidase assembly protein [Tenacibaculum holothuriorum]|uniref:Cytochrome oxidase assembly protein n=1 Tax=Tenacibaculum holothuriorum TaxID=1635173 RepID=A0A1Y2P9E2_9FLAO|nr:COX15/CtaA family protein [Tenacibaculum holothuriorum]OSY87065.1 cytochrome oxidase assembly protein [Tenacibaculum holothuriorum]
MKKHFPLLVKITLIAIYVIFLAGSVVRMTGSGMGCPDWPKCFGYYIPPTSEEQITWQPNKDYKKGMIIVKDEALFVAEKDLKTATEFNLNNWSKYTKHNYAKFNKLHTWTEYINRLSSALAGIPFLLLVITCFSFWKENKKITLITLGAFALMLFEAWLGKTVVDTNLKPTVITIHMVAGLFIVALLLWLLHIVNKKPFDPTQGDKLKYNSVFNKLLIVSVVFSLIQIALGTQVRQFIDEQVRLYGFEHKQYSLLNPSFKFYFHRSFTIAIVLVNLAMFYLNQIKNLGYNLVNWIVFLIFLETITGILMYYAEFPLGTQAIHLLAGSVLFGLQFYLLLQSRKS